MNATAKQIFNEIQSLNPSTYTISSLGSYVSQSSQMVSDSIRAEVLTYLPKDSIAYKIAMDANKFSDKQLWVISFELERNKEYTEMLAKKIADLQDEIAFAKARKSAKRAAKTLAKNETKQKIEENKASYEAISVGHKVEHAVFGVGSVTSETEDTITVFFEKVGEKKLVKKFVKLTNL